MAVAPRTVHRIPAGLSRCPMTGVQPAATTPEPTKQPWSRTCAARLRGAWVSKEALRTASRAASARGRRRPTPAPSGAMAPAARSVQRATAALGSPRASAPRSTALVWTARPASASSFGDGRLAPPPPPQAPPARAAGGPPAVPVPGLREPPVGAGRTAGGGRPAGDGGGPRADRLRPVVHDRRRVALPAGGVRAALAAALVPGGPDGHLGRLQVGGAETLGLREAPPDPAVSCPGHVLATRLRTGLLRCARGGASATAGGGRRSPSCSWPATRSAHRRTTVRAGSTSRATVAHSGPSRSVRARLSPAIVAVPRDGGPGPRGPGSAQAPVGLPQRRTCTEMVPRRTSPRVASSWDSRVRVPCTRSTVSGIAPPLGELNDSEHSDEAISTARGQILPTVLSHTRTMNLGGGVS